MKITTIVPLYNSEKFLNETIESILNQTLKDFEIILVDDNSTDSTFKLAESYINNFKNIHLYKNKYTKGISGSMNTALEVAKGQYIALIDHDDLCLPNRFEKQFDYMEENINIGVCGSWMQEFDEGDSVWKFPTDNSELKAICLLHSPIPNPTAMIRKSALDKYNIKYNSDFDTAQDYEFWLKLLPHTEFHILPEVLVKYRIHSGNTSNVHKDKQFDAWKRAIKPIINKLNLSITDLDYEYIYEMKYPSFYKKYSEKKSEILNLTDSIIKANTTKNIFPNKELEKIFKDKISKWESDILLNKLQ